MMSFLERIDEILVRLILLGRKASYLDERVSAFTYSRSDYNRPVFLNRLLYYVAALRHALGAGD